MRNSSARRSDLSRSFSIYFKFQRKWCIAGKNKAVEKSFRMWTFCFQTSYCWVIGRIFIKEIRIFLRPLTTFTKGNCHFFIEINVLKIHFFYVISNNVTVVIFFFFCIIFKDKSTKLMKLKIICQEVQFNIA